MQIALARASILSTAAIAAESGANFEDQQRYEKMFGPNHQINLFKALFPLGITSLNNGLANDELANSFLYSEPSNQQELNQLLTSINEALENVLELIHLDVGALIPYQHGSLLIPASKQ